jgi:K+-sensing histidine kinase KdpD
MIVRCPSPRRQRLLILHLRLGQKFAKAWAGSAEKVQPSNRPFAPDESASATILKEAVALLTSVVSIGLVTAALLPLGRDVATNLVPVAYLIPVVFAATRWGIWPAMLASIAGMASADFFFFAPLYSLRVDDPQEAIDLLLFLIVSLVSSNLASGYVGKRRRFDKERPKSSAFTNSRSVSPPASRSRI